MQPHEWVLLFIALSLIYLTICIILIDKAREYLIEIISKEILLYIILGLVFTIIAEVVLWPSFNGFFSGLDGIRFADKIYSYLFDKTQGSSDPISTLTFLLGVVVGLIVLLYTFEYVKRKGNKVLRLTDSKDQFITLIYYILYLILIFILFPLLFYISFFKIYTFIHYMSHLWSFEHLWYIPITDKVSLIGWVIELIYISIALVLLFIYKKASYWLSDYLPAQWGFYEKLRQLDNPATRQQSNFWNLFVTKRFLCFLKKIVLYGSTQQIAPPEFGSLCDDNELTLIIKRIKYLQKNIDFILKFIFVIMVITTILGFIFNVNIFTIIFLEIALLSWYFFLSIICILPSRKWRIWLNDDDKWKLETALRTIDGYIIDGGFEEDYFGILKEDNRIHWFNKSDILKYKEILPNDK